MSPGPPGLVRGALVLAAMLAACTDTPTDPVTVAVDGLASARTEKLKIPFPFAFLNNCTGEDVVGTGTLHRRRTVTDDGNGGLHVTLHVNFSNVTAVGVPSATVYRAQQNIHVSRNIRGPFPVTVTIHNNVRFVAKKSGAEFFLTGDRKLVINANGDVVLDENNFPRTLECR